MRFQLHSVRGTLACLAVMADGLSLTIVSHSFPIYPKEYKQITNILCTVMRPGSIFTAEALTRMAIQKNPAALAIFRKSATLISAGIGRSEARESTRDRVAFTQRCTSAALCVCAFARVRFVHRRER